MGSSFDVAGLDSGRRFPKTLLGRSRHRHLATEMKVICTCTGTRQSSQRKEPMQIDRDARVFVAGHRGLVGSALVRKLEAEGFTNILTATRDQLDLRDQSEVSHWFKANRPEYVFLVAGTVGGILANSTRPAEFIYDNMMIHGTVVARRSRVRREEAAVPRLVVHLPPPGRPSRSPRTHCSPARSSRPTSGTRSPRSPGSSCARRTAASTAATSSPRCRPTCTARATTST